VRAGKKVGERESEGEVAFEWDRPDGETRWQREKANGPLWVAIPKVGPTGSGKGGMTGGPEPGKEKKKKKTN
jgi:hypothetical protein